MADHFSLSEEQNPELLKKCDKEPNQRDKNDEDDEPIFIGMKHVKEDSDIVFVKVISNPKHITSNILNRVTPGSYSKRKKGHPQQVPAHVSQCGTHVTPVAKAMAAMTNARSEWKSTDSPIPTESSSKLAYTKSSPEILSPYDSKQLVTADKISRNPKRFKLTNEIPSIRSSAITPSALSPIMDTGATPKSTCLSSHVQNGTSLPWPHANEKTTPALTDPDPENTSEDLAKTGLSSLASQNNTSDPKRGKLILLLSDFYYGHQKGDGQLEPKTHSTFRCLSCLKVLKNVKFMNHMKHHLELERQRGDSWENHTTCQHCHRQFPTPFQLQCHIDRVHTTQEPSAVCKICELSFETDQILLQHMKDNHKPGEMPYACQLCNYRSSAFADVEAHFRACHENTKNLLCLFCLKMFKAANPYMSHCWRHWSKKRVFPCSQCRLQFLSLKGEIEHKTKDHQTFKKPQPLEGLPPGTRVIIQTSLHSSTGTESIIVSNTDSCLSPVRTKNRKNSRYSGLLCSQGSG